MTVNPIPMFLACPEPKLKLLKSRYKRLVRDFSAPSRDELLDFLPIRSRYSHNPFHSVFKQLYAVAMGYVVAFGPSRQLLLYLVDEVAWEVTSLPV